MKSNQPVNQFQLQKVANPVTQLKGFLINTMFFSLWAYPIKQTSPDTSYLHDPTLYPRVLRPNHCWKLVFKNLAVNRFRVTINGKLLQEQCYPRKIVRFKKKSDRVQKVKLKLDENTAEYRNHVIGIKRSNLDW